MIKYEWINRCNYNLNLNRIKMQHPNIGGTIGEEEDGQDFNFGNPLVDDINAGGDN